jgi:alanine racemase
MYRRTTARIDLAAIRANYDLACSLAPQSKNVAVIKANAYGHGMLRVAESLQELVPAFAVATIDEALQLREAGLENELLVLEGGTNTAAYKIAAANDLTLVVHAVEQVDGIVAAGVSIRAWLKVDSGMHRLGLSPGDVRLAYERLTAGKIDVRVVCTHLACADEPGSDATRRQLDVFNSSVREFGVPKSVSNSAGILAWPESHAEWNRPGYMLYGNTPFMSDVGTATTLQPAMTLCSEIIAIRTVSKGDAVGYGGGWLADRPSVIGTVAIGYGDGYPRHAPDGTPTLVNGRIAPLVGAVSMDMITIDITDHDGVNVGDSVELWGRGVSLRDVATRAGTIGYQLLTGVSARVPRIYV